MTLRCVVVTPERTELDREAEYVSLPVTVTGGVAGAWGGFRERAHVWVYRGSCGGVRRRV